MKRRAAAAVIVAALVSALLGASPGRAVEASDPSLDPEKGTLSGSPADHLPAYITQVLPHGMRPDWSPNGRALIYLDGPLGDVWRLNLRTGRERSLTGHLDRPGFLRAHHLPNGDLVLCGPRKAPPPDSEEPGRFDGVLWILKKPYTGRVVPLKRPCWEGIAVSRRRNTIAWNESDIDFTADDVFVQAATGKSEIWMGDITRGRRGRPHLTDVRLVTTRWETVPTAPIEVQDFRGPREHELIFTAYAHLTGEVMGFDMRTRRTVDYSVSPFYEEAEGVARDGSFVLVERDLMVNPIPGALDIWQLSLDGALSWKRLTHFNRHKGYGASNPVVSPDGRRVAFQLSLSDGAEGEGAGLFVLDLRAVP